VSAISAGRPGSGNGRPGEPAQPDRPADGSRDPADLFVDARPRTEPIDLFVDTRPLTQPVDLFVDPPAEAGAAQGPEGPRGPRRPASHRRRVAVALVVAAVVVALGAAAVGFLLTSGGPLSAIGLSASPPPAPVAGTAGLVPGGPAVPVGFVAVGTAESGGVTVRTIEADAESLPLACPPSAWVITVPEPVTIAVATVPTRIPARVTLSDDAPSGCQGVTVQALTGTVTAATSGGDGTQLHSTAERPLTVATLGTPAIAVTTDSGAAVVVITADRAAPAGIHYSVESAAPGGEWRSACQLAEPTPCATGQRAETGTTRYRVTARLGSFWRRTSAVVQA
jgi:hypothetical protein